MENFFFTDEELKILAKVYINHREMYTAIVCYRHYCNDRNAQIEILRDIIDTVEEYSDCISLSDDDDYICYRLIKKCEKELKKLGNDEDKYLRLYIELLKKI